MMIWERREFATSCHGLKCVPIQKAINMSKRTSFAQHQRVRRLPAPCSQQNLLQGRVLTLLSFYYTRLVSDTLTVKQLKAQSYNNIAIICHNCSLIDQKATVTNRKQGCYSCGIWPFIGRVLHGLIS